MWVGQRRRYCRVMEINTTLGNYISYLIVNLAENCFILIQNVPTMDNHFIKMLNVMSMSRAITANVCNITVCVGTSVWGEGGNNCPTCMIPYHLHSTVTSDYNSPTTLSLLPATRGEFISLSTGT